jgi:hypothetical protein
VIEGKLEMSELNQGPQPGAPNAPKKTSPLIWILAGVLGLFALMGVVVIAGGLFVAKKASEMAANPGLAAVKLMVAANPDLELVSSDEGTGKVTIREKQTGKVVTANFDQIKDGRITFEQDGEKVSIEAPKNGDAIEIKGKDAAVHIGGDAKLPHWLPAYPGATAKVAGAQSDSAAGQSGMVVFTTGDEPQKVLDFYRDALKKAGIADLLNTTTTSDGKLAGMLTGQSADQPRSAQVLFGSNEGKTSATITYSTKK